MAWDLFEPLGVIAQLDGSEFGSENCACASAAMHAMSERQGRKPAKGSPWPPTGASIRKASGDKSGGLKASQIDETMNRVYGIDPDFQVASAGLVETKLDTGYGLIYLHRYGPISDSGLSGSPGFRGNHSAFVSGKRTAPKAAKSCDTLYDGRKTGIPEGPQWVPWSAWVRAGETLVVNDSGQRMIDRYGPGKLYVGFTRIPYRPGAPIKTVQYSVAFSAAIFWCYDVMGGVIVRRDARQFSGATSARCSAPRVYPWPGQVPRRLVRMTAGALKGQYIAVPQGGLRLVEKEVAL